MNHGEIGRLRFYMNSMIVWVLLIMGVNNLNWKATADDAYGHYKDLQRYGLIHGL